MFPVPLNPYASIGFLSGSGLSATGTEGQQWLNPAAVVPGSGLWNPNPPNSLTGNPNPPNGLTGNPNPPNSNTGNPNPPQEPNRRRWPQPTQAPVPRIGIDPDWVFSSPATLLAQALRRSAARIERAPSGKVQASQMGAAQVKGARVVGSDLWRWAPEFRAKTVAAELLGRFQVVAGTVYLVGVCSAGGKLHCRPVFSVPADLRGAGLRMTEQVDKVVRAAVEREDRMAEILSQMNDLWPFFESITGVSLDRAPRTAELLAATHDFLLYPLMHLKQDVALMRPVQASSLVVPLIPTPGHGSMPSGHATQAAFTSELLHILLYARRSDPSSERRSQQLDRLARRIAFNRVVAGVHFPVDSLVGYRLGTQMARLVAALGGHGRGFPAPVVETDTLQGFELSESDPRQLRPDWNSDPSEPVTGCSLLKALWDQAEIELGELSI
jgi:hypothetical protein